MSRSLMMRVSLSVVCCLLQVNNSMMGGNDWQGGEGKYGGGGGGVSGRTYSRDLDDSDDMSPMRGRGGNSFGDADDQGWSSAAASAGGGYGRK